MANVPLYPVDGTTQQNELPTVRVSPNATGAQSGAMFQDLGNKVQDGAAYYTMLQNQVRVNDALNQVRQKALDLTYDPQSGYQVKKGVNALQPNDQGQSMTQDYGQQLGSTIDTISSSLTPEQQRVFQMQAKDLQTSFVGGVQQHVFQQSQAYALSTQQNTMKTIGDMVGQVWNDPDKVIGTPNPQTGQYEGGLVQQAKAAAYATSKLLGQDASDAVFEAGSNVHTAVIKSALENQNPVYAANYFGSHKSEMTTDDILRVQGQITQQATAQIVQGTVNSQAQKLLQPATLPSDIGRLSNLVAQQESGNRETNADGSTVTSPAGAKGRMQVLDSTALNPGFGIAPAKQLPDGSIDAADRDRVGQQYLSALVQKYGNVPQALAAYNAGPGAVDQAISTANARRTPDWLSILPKETQDYVAAIAPKYAQPGGGTPSLPTKDAFVSSVLDSLPPNSTPQAIGMARQSAEARYTLATQSRDEQGDQALRQVQQALVQNGGDYAALQRDHPELISTLTTYAPGKVDDAVLYAKHISKGENVTNLPAYGAAVTHPEDLAKLTDAQMDQFVRTNMSVADGEKLYRLRAEYLNGTSDQSAGSLNQAALNSKLNKTLLDLGLDSSAKDTATKIRIGDIQQSMSDGILAQQKAQNKKFTQADINAYVDHQASLGTIVPKWFGMSSAPQRLYSTTISDLSSTDKTAIHNQLASERGLPPDSPLVSDSDIMKRYFAVKSHGQ